MTKPNSRLWARILSAGVLTAALANAQAGGGRAQWLAQRIRTLANKAAPAAEAGSTKTQAGTPSIDPGSPSIIDRSKPTEFFDVAMALAQSGGTAGTGPTGTATATLYSLLASIQRKSLIDPDFYEQQHYLRRLSFTAGTAKSDLAKDGTTTDAAVYGARINLIDGTDLFSTSKDRPRLIDQLRSNLRQDVQDAQLFVLMDQIVSKNAQLSLEDKIAIFQTAGSTENWVASLPAQDRNEIEQRVKVVASEDAALADFLNTIHYNTVSKPRLLSIAYYTNQRKDGGADDHRAELIFDYGFNRRLSWTVNAGAEYRNVYKHTGGDRKGGRFATEFQYKLYALDPAGAVLDRWVTFDFGAEWKALTRAKPYYKGQAKLTIPLMEGLSLPIVWSYESNITLANGSIGPPAEKKFRFGIAFDPGKMKALRQ